MRYPTEEELKTDWTEFLHEREDGVEVCGLCGNNGLVWGKAAKKNFYCICPNGRMRKISVEEFYRDEE